MNRREKSVDNTRDPSSSSNSRAKKSLSAEPFNSSLSSSSSASRKKSKFAFWTNLSFWSKPNVQPVKVSLSECNGASSSYPRPPDDDNLEQDLGSSYESVNSIATTTSFAFVSPKKLPKGRRIPVDDEGSGSRTLPGQQRAREGTSGSASVRLGLKKKYGLQSCESLEHVESRGGTLQRRRARLQANANFGAYELPSTSGGFSSDTGTLTGTDTARRKRKAPPVPIPPSKEPSGCVKVAKETTSQSQAAEEESLNHPPQNASPELSRLFPHPIPVPSTSTSSSNNVELLKVTCLSGTGGPSTKLSRVPSKRESYPGVSAQQRKGRLNCACSTSIFASHSRRAKFPCGSDHCIHRKGVHVKGKKKAPPPPNPFGDPDSDQPPVEVKKVPRNPFYEDPEESTPPNIAKESSQPSSSTDNTLDETNSVSPNESEEIRSIPKASPIAQVSSPTASTESSSSTSTTSNSKSGNSNSSVAGTSGLTVNNVSVSSQIEAPRTTSGTEDISPNVSNSKPSASNGAQSTSAAFLRGAQTITIQPNVSESTTSSKKASSKPETSSSVIYATIATTPSTVIPKSLPVTTAVTTPTSALSSVTSSKTVVSPISSSSVSSQSVSTSSPVQLRKPTSSSSSVSSRVPFSNSGTYSPQPSRESSTSIFTFISAVPVVSTGDEIRPSSSVSSNIANSSVASTSVVSSVPSTSTVPLPTKTATSSLATSSSSSPVTEVPATNSQPLPTSSAISFSPEALALADEIAQNLLNDEQERQLLQESATTSTAATVSSPSPSSKTKSPRGSIFNFSRAPKKSSSGPSNSADLESLLHSSQTLRAQLTAVDQQVRAHLVEESPPVSPGRAHHDKSPMFFFSSRSSRNSLPPSTTKEATSGSPTPPPASGESSSSPKVTLRPWYKRLSGGGGNSGGSSKPKPSVISLPKFSDLDKEATRIVEENKRRSAELAFNANARTLIDIFNETFEPITPTPNEESERDLREEASNVQTNLPPKTETPITQTNAVVTSTTSSSIVPPIPSSSSTAVNSHPSSSISASTPTSKSGAIPKTSIASSAPVTSSNVISKGSEKATSKQTAVSISSTTIPSISLSATQSKPVSSNSTPATITVSATSISSLMSTTTATASSTSIKTTSSVVTPVPSSAVPKTTIAVTSSSQPTDESKTIAVVQPQSKQSSNTTNFNVSTSSSNPSTVGNSVRQLTTSPTVTSTSVFSRPTATSNSSNTTLSQATPSSPVSSPGEDWSCPRCTLKNSYWRALCEACYLRRDSGTNQSTNSMSAILQQVNSNVSSKPSQQPTVSKTPSSPTLVSSPSTPSTPTTTPVAKPTQAVKPKASSSTAPACENFLSQLPLKEIPGKHEVDKNKLLQQNSSAGVRLVEDPEVEELSLERLRRARLAFFQKDQEEKASQLASSEKTPRGPSPGKRNNLTTPSNSISSFNNIPKHSINVFDDGEDSFLDNCTRLPAFPPTFVNNIPPCLLGPSSSSPFPGGSGWRPLLAPITEADANLYCLSEWDRIYENWELPSDDSPQRPATAPGPLPTSVSYNPNFLASVRTTHNTLSEEEEDESVLEMERTRKHRTHNTHNKSAAGSGGAMGGVGDLFAVEENERGVAALLRKLEWAIGAGEHRLAASLAHDLALLKVKVAALGPATPTDPITIRVYVEDRFMQQGPFLVQVWESMRVSELKAKIESDWGIPVNFQKWILGQQMAEGDTAPLASFHLKNNSLAFLYLVTPNIHQKPPKASPSPPLVPPKVPQTQGAGSSKATTSASAISSPRTETHLQNGHGETKPSGSRSPSKMGQTANNQVCSSELKAVPTSTPPIKTANLNQPSSAVKNTQDPGKVVGTENPKNPPVVFKSDKVQEKPGNQEPITEPRKPVEKSSAQAQTISVRKENTDNGTVDNVPMPKLQETRSKQESPTHIGLAKVSPKISKDEKTGSIPETSNKPPVVPVTNKTSPNQSPKTLSRIQPHPTTTSTKEGTVNNDVHDLSSPQSGDSATSGTPQYTCLKVNTPISKPTPINLKKDDLKRERSDSDSSKGKEQKTAQILTVETPNPTPLKELPAGIVRGRPNSLQQKLAHLRQAAEQAFGKTFGAQQAAPAETISNINTSGKAKVISSVPAANDIPAVSTKDDPRPKPRVKKVPHHPKLILSVFHKEESSSSGGEESSSSSKANNNIRGKVRIQNPVDSFCQTTLDFPKTKSPQVISEATRTKSPEVVQTTYVSASSGSNGFSPAELEDIRMHIPSPVEQFESKPSSPQPSNLHVDSTTTSLEDSSLKSPEKAPATSEAATIPAVLTPQPNLIITPEPGVAHTNSSEKGQLKTVNPPSNNLVESAVPNVQHIPSSSQDEEVQQSTLAVQSATSNLPISIGTEQQTPNSEGKSISGSVVIDDSSSNVSTSIDSPNTPAVPSSQGESRESTPRKSHLPPVILRAGKPPPGPTAPPSSNGLPGRPHFLSHRRVSQIEIPAQFKQDVAPPTPSSLKKAVPSFPSYSGSKTSFNQSPKPFGTPAKEPEKKSLLQRKNSDSSIANLVLDANEDLSSLGAAALPPQSYEKKESNVDTYLRMLEDLEKLDLIPCAEQFDCPVCFLPVGPGEGVTLRDCLHNFCRECLVGAVKYADISTVGCPFRDDSYSCTSSLQEREIKALVPPDVFEAYLARSVKLAERVMTNTFHCRTNDCPGWCIFEDDVNSFLCPVCKKRNCLTCQAIHEDMDCRQYQRQMAIAAETDEDAKSSRLMLEKMIERGEALDCPACHVVLLKKWGCDWVRCSYCKTEICWVTKGFRWGPGGKGDTSGGCKCGVNGVRCHPKCTYCH